MAVVYCTISKKLLTAEMTAGTYTGYRQAGWTHARPLSSPGGACRLGWMPLRPDGTRRPCSCKTCSVTGNRHSLAGDRQQVCYTKDTSQVCIWQITGNKCVTHIQQTCSGVGGCCGLDLKRKGFFLFVCPKAELSNRGEPGVRLSFCSHGGARIYGYRFSYMDPHKPLPKAKQRKATQREAKHVGT